MRYSRSCGSKFVAVVAAAVMAACANAADRPPARAPAEPTPKVVVSSPSREVEDRLDELDRRAAELDAATKRWGTISVGDEVLVRRAQNGIGSSSKGL